MNTWKLHKEPALVAAVWWADQLRRVSKQDNGVPLHGLMAALMGAHETLPVQHATDRFEAALARLLEEEEQRQGCATVGCDYGPDPILRVAASECGIRASCPPFPMKTVMWADNLQVSVRYGYGAEIQVLWTRKLGLI